ncbi:amphi-Trp domain-containing protein [Natrialbaceae archaeon AArc-T1-2]|uniref:amphi-Trp domain-containing protein n=1 Tax=Natrialbaceae archaeon AArc-T1-2 TaxID=3053904 RepID=UPI00255AA7CE|nr:amphi-Trp domain-containing protein [Natrialbaceae archaeon AArc-T1-2]WIV67924.1 amphi-Trp domain-containing protein [Natrialbaceae archaeon AArc-T1-2]
MAETTDYDDEISREEASELIEELAHELRGDGPTNVRVGNKRVRLSPGDVLEYHVEVEERSPMFGGNRQSITLSLEWRADEKG